MSSDDKPRSRTNQVSRTPPLIESVRSGGFIAKNTHGGRGEAVDWTLWKSMLTAMLYEAVALAMGLNPGEFFSDVASTSAYDGKTKAQRFFGDDFPKNLRIAEDHLNQGSLPKSIRGAVTNEFTKVDLRAFCVWANSVGWLMSPDFIAAFGGSASTTEELDADTEQRMAATLQARSEANAHRNNEQTKQGVPRQQPKWRVQEKAILAALQDLKFNPMQLPQPSPGKVYPAKKAVRKQLRYSEDVMNKAWVRLKNFGEIRYVLP